jgi:hypothetical protein
MMTNQEQYELAQGLASDIDTTNLTLLQGLISRGNRKFAKVCGYYPKETFTFTTYTDAISGTSYLAYRLPIDFYKFSELYVTSGSNQYWATLVQDDQRWRVMQSASFSSNVLTDVFIRRDRMELYPIPSSALTATFRYRALPPRMYAADYATGTITTLTNGSTAVVAASSTFTSAMAGRWFKITNDGQWYKIASVTDTTHLVLENEYQGLSIAAGTDAYKIGQIANLPPETHDIPVEFALWQFELMRKNITLAREHKAQWLEGIKDVAGDVANLSDNAVIDDTKAKLRAFRGINPNYYPTGMS